MALLRARELSELEPLMDQGNPAWEELRRTVALLKGSPVRLDFSLGNDMKYYSGLVFKGYARGVPTSVLSGGQYDRLLSHMGKKARAIGFAVYLDRLPVEDKEQADADTLLIFGDAAPGEVLAAVEAIGGTVLAAKTQPAQGRWKRRAVLEHGEVRYLD